MISTLDIKVEKAAQSRVKDLDTDNIPFGKIYSDHMFLARYEDKSWKEPEIVPYDYLKISPASQALHYGVSVFEGMKAYKTVNNETVLFRPLSNYKRMNVSAERLCMPNVPEEYFIEGINQLLRLDEAWIPSKEGTALYVRPIMFSSEEYIGIKPSEDFIFMIITCPVGAYYTKPVRVKIEKKYARAVEGGTGYAKAAGNYAGSLYPALLAQKQGYDQLIWTDGKQHEFIEEAGTMNLMFIVDNTIITPALTDTILHGITRDSILTLARDLGYKVEERKISVEEIVNNLKKGTLSDAFGVGTAATLTHISEIGYEGTDFKLPPVGERSISTRLKTTLEDIKIGKEKDKFNWVHRI